MSTTPSEAAAHALAAALLEQGRTVHLLSCAMTAVSLAGLGLVLAFSPNPAACLLVATAALLGAAEAYLAVRVGFDAAIFRLAAAGAMEWDDFDRARTALGLVRGQPIPRSGESRAKGALGLLRRQGLAAALQFGMLLAASAALA